MIQIYKREKQTRQSKFISIEVVGHAGYAPIGNDIVCAGVSTLYETLLLTLNAIDEKNVSSDGNKDMQVIIVKNPSHEANICLGFFYIGIEAIAKTYPEYVEMIDE